MPNLLTLFVSELNPTTVTSVCGEQRNYNRTRTARVAFEQILDTTIEQYFAGSRYIHVDNDVSKTQPITGVNSKHRQVADKLEHSSSHLQDILIHTSVFLFALPVCISLNLIKLLLSPLLLPWYIYKHNTIVAGLNAMAHTMFDCLYH